MNPKFINNLTFTATLPLISCQFAINSLNRHLAPAHINSPAN